MTTHWTVTVEEDPVTKDLILPLPADMLAQVGWDIGDVVDWKEENGAWIISKVEKQKEEENPDVERIRRETGDIVLKDGSRINRWGQEDFTPPGWERRTWPKEEDRPDHKQHREGKPSRTIGEETENESKQAPTNKELQTDLSKILEKIAFFEEKSKNSNMNLNTGTITRR